ncbi:hypothetical protein ALP98_100220 [Pseudomonas viridiflava]|uniref:Uncharacterized protein n=4 Tax=Pseudomonas syringae group TaxID=136849 RepID=A0A7Z6Y0R5_PSESF|nr:hypothetical protein ALQ30_100156 [Pseudomonas syringae pv. persicae]RMP84514.1 hypothetical protein ALQ15_100452 [Pseudomonas syringae pv. actinidiae]RMQ14213.1 hypothetical protein ALQ09_100162 [Pseudomonas viridiflava]RMQ68985.1 hypothetical protein ALP98_100220 [Pseudomonas viridiflava]RMR55419.1 hypothetical protein ALP83_100132 [Pseudomonas syringae pv. actinidiae]
MSGKPGRAIIAFHLKAGCVMSEQERKRQEALVRQRYYRERQRAEGFKQSTIWIHGEAETQGRLAAREGKPLLPMQSHDPVSWAVGWVAEKLRTRQ